MKNILRCCIDWFHIARYYWADFRLCISYSRTTGKKSEIKSLAEISLLMHALEKGLSFSEKKAEFGREKAQALVRILRTHIEKYGLNDRVYVALSILNVYLADSHSTGQPEIRNEILTLIESYSSKMDFCHGGAKHVEIPDFNLSYEQLLAFFESRISVRDYADTPITDTEIEGAKRIAMTTPSACNRQASRVYTIRNKETMMRLFALQGGDQGWCNHAAAVFIVTTDLSFFGGYYERNQVYIDGGLFAMNFMMGLHAQKIASCYKMYLRNPQMDRDVKRLCGISESEIPIVLILAGHYLPSALSPISHKYILK